MVEEKSKAASRNSEPVVFGVKENVVRGSQGFNLVAHCVRIHLCSRRRWWKERLDAIRRGDIQKSMVDAKTHEVPPYQPTVFLPS